MAGSVTQRDVAKVAGVSQATVSIVLSGAGLASIPQETVMRVNEAVDQLGYTPNRFAQALRTNRTMTIACIVPDITNPFYPSLVRGVQTVAEDAGYDVITVNSDGQKDREIHFLNMARQGRVDGLIGVFFRLTIAEISPIVEKGVPVVRLEASVKSGGNVSVDDLFTDNFSAAQDLTNFLLNKGHRSIAMIAGRGGPQSVRVDGYKHALKGRNIAPTVELHDAFTEEGGASAMARLLADGQMPTAVIAANDLMAIGAISTLRENSISIPQQIAVAGFDDIPAARLVTPTLTTVNQFQGRLGAEAARMLLARLGKTVSGPGQAHEQPFEIIERAST